MSACRQEATDRMTPAELAEATEARRRSAAALTDEEREAMHQHRASLMPEEA